MSASPSRIVVALVLLAVAGVVTGAMVALPLTADPPDDGDAPAGGLAPDIVVITLDTTRADHLGSYGYFRSTSPTFDALARSSVLFEHLVVPMATTLPTHTSLFTGTWPAEHGILANVQHGGQKFLPSDGLTTLATWARGQGYQTAAFVSAAPLNHTSGIEAGFDVFDEPDRIERSGDKTADAALAWLGSAPVDQPMVFWVHFYDPHNPYTAPPRYGDFGEDGEVLDAWMDAHHVDKVTHRPTGGAVRAKPTINAYDAEIRFMDDQLARVLDGLRARGRFDDATLLVVMGDHGEGLNQHGEPGHGLVWGEQLHAPLLMRWPGAEPARNPTLLSAADVLPTALRRAPLPHVDGFLGQASGRDVLARDFQERPVLSQTSERQLQFGVSMTYALTGPALKCVWSQGESVQLWDLTADPYELAPLQDDPRAADCEVALTETLAVQQARGTQLGSGHTVPMSDAEIEALRALGYVGDDGGPGDGLVPEPEPKAEDAPAAPSAPEAP
ncbi:MAG: sulfatase [Alphaproteobacteria bacterium]|nr:sulfatase [Alphaproteobacteria bacterium]